MSKEPSRGETLVDHLAALAYTVARSSGIAISLIAPIGRRPHRLGDVRCACATSDPGAGAVQDAGDGMAYPGAGAQGHPRVRT